MRRNHCTLVVLLSATYRDVCLDWWWSSLSFQLHTCSALSHMYILIPWCLCYWNQEEKPLWSSTRYCHLCVFAGSKANTATINAIIFCHPASWVVCTKYKCTILPSLLSPLEQGSAFIMCYLPVPIIVRKKLTRTILAILCWCCVWRDVRWDW